MLPLWVPLTAFRRNASRAVISSIRHLTNLSDTRRIHCHNYMEIGYCLSGSGLYYIRGEVYPVGQGDIPLEAIIAALEADGYDGCYELEWEKKWHPELRDAEEEFPAYVQFMKGIRA